MSNFKFPYFSRNIGEFWRRWHISLSTWFRDYLYIPLGGSQKGKWMSIRNIFIIFLVSGFWHGANWNFVFWGLFHSMFFLPSFIFNTNRKYTASIIAENTLLPKPKEIIQIGKTFIVVTIGWVFFRSDTLEDSFIFLYKMIFDFDINLSKASGLLYIILLTTLDYMIRTNERDIIFTKNKLANNSLFILFIISIVLLFFKETRADFIYFQF